MPVSTRRFGADIMTNPSLRLEHIARARRTSAGTVASEESAADAPAAGNAFLSREQILVATEACFAEDGYDGTTIRAIAGRLGCSVGSIYRYFDDKRDLLAACAARVLEPVADALERGEADFGSSVGRYVEAAGARPQMYRLLLWLSDPAAGSTPQTSQGPIERIVDCWGGLLGDAARARRCWAMVHGLLALGEEPGRIAAAVTASVAALPMTPATAAAAVVVDSGAIDAPSDEDVTLL